jgi:hypothetical protein
MERIAALKTLSINWEIIQYIDFEIYFIHPIQENEQNYGIYQRINRTNKIIIK